MMSYRRCTFSPFSSQLCVMLSNSSGWSRWITLAQTSGVKDYSGHFINVYYSEREKLALEEYTIYITQFFFNSYMRILWYKILYDKRVYKESLGILDRDLSRPKMYEWTLPVGECWPQTTSHTKCLFSMCDLRPTSHKFRITREVNVFFFLFLFQNFYELSSL